MAEDWGEVKIKKLWDLVSGRTLRSYAGTKGLGHLEPESPDTSLSQGLSFLTP